MRFPNQAKREGEKKDRFSVTKPIGKGKLQIRFLSSFSLSFFRTPTKKETPFLLLSLSQWSKQCPSLIEPDAWEQKEKKREEETQGPGAKTRKRKVLGSQNRVARSMLTVSLIM